MSHVLCCHTFDWSLFWVFITAIATLMLALVAGFQLSSFNKTSRFEFYHKLKADFFTESSNGLITLIYYDALVFEKGELIEVEGWDTPDYCAHYSVKNNVLDKIGKYANVGERKIVTLSDIENNLLNQFEDLDMLEKNEVLDFNIISEGFGTYIEIVMGNKEVQKHIEFLRKPREKDKYDSEVYVGATRLYKKIIKIKGQNTN